MTLPEGFAATIVGARENVRDAFVSNRYASLEDLPKGAIVGTSSLRRESQLRHYFTEMRIEPLRGNVNTRLKKLDNGEFDAIILAAAGLKRLGFEARIKTELDEVRFIPAIAQGALGIEYRADRADIAAWLAPFATTETTAIVAAERALGRALTGSCDVPLGGRGQIVDGQLRLEGFVALPDGTRVIRDTVMGSIKNPEAIGVALGKLLIEQGAAEILAMLTRQQS